MQRRVFVIGALAAPLAHAHHGWSSFDQTRPLYVEGRVAKVAWRNPHAELSLELPAELKLPADLARRTLPAQSAPVEGPKLLQAAQLPSRKDRTWHIELAPVSRLEAWQLAPVKVGDQIAVVGYTFPGEKGEAVLRGEYIFVGGKAYGLRSSPA